MTWWYNSASSVVLVIGAFSGFVAGVCYQMRHSRCENISLCWGCWKCNRILQTTAEADADDIRNKTNRPTPPDAGEI